MLRVPGWLVFVVVLPLQLVVAWHLLVAWGFWWTLLFLVGLGVLANRAAAPHWFRALLSPRWAQAWQDRRHVYQGVLFLLVVVTALVPRVDVGLPAWIAEPAAGWPQPWLPLAFLASLVKSALR